MINLRFSTWEWGNSQHPPSLHTPPYEPMLKPVLQLNTCKKVLILLQYTSIMRVSVASAHHKRQSYLKDMYNMFKITIH